MEATSALWGLLSPMSESEFLADVYQQRALHLPGHAGRFADLFSWDAVSDVLNSSLFPHPTLKMNRQGRPVKVTGKGQVISELKAGTTMIIDNADSYSRSLANFCDRLSHEYLTPVRTNAYISFPDIQAFDLHYDTHDFLILQVSGKKRWFVYDRTVESPLYLAKTHGVVPPATPPLLEVTLEEGDVLYVPKGFWHYAVSTEEPSIHLTLAVFVRTGIDFMNWLVGELREDVAFRREFPLVRNAGPAEREGEHPYSPLLRSMAERLAGILEEGDLADRFESYMASQLLHRRRFRLPADFAGRPPISGLSTFRRIGILPHVRKGATIEIAFHGQSFQLDRRHDALVDVLFSEEEGTIGFREVVDRSGCDAGEAAEALAVFCEQGLLEIVS